MSLSLAQSVVLFFFFFQAEDGIRDPLVTGVQTCALPISDVLDDAGAFVTEEDREGHAPAVRELDVEIGVADTARSQADEDLVVPEIIEGNRLDSDALAGRVQHRPPIAHRERLRPRFYRTVVWYIVRAHGTAGGEGERA